MPDTLVAHTVGANIAAERKRSGFGQSVLAERLKVTQATVSRWERGDREIGLSELLRVAAVLECPLQSLVSGAVAPDGYRQGYEDGWRACAEDVSRYLLRGRRVAGDA